MPRRAARARGAPIDVVLAASRSKGLRFSSMQFSFGIPAFAVTFAMACFPSDGHAEEPTGSKTPGGDDSAGVTPPTVRTQVAPAYPPDALRDRSSGVVAVELTIDEAGRVVDARITQHAGHGFDESVMAVVRRWTFEPARKAGTPVKSVVELSIPFQPPTNSSAQPPSASDEAQPLLARAPSATPSPSAAPNGEQGSTVPPVAEAQTQTTLVLGRRPISAASSAAVRDRDFSLRPIGSVQDILRVTPGLVMVQHSGGGKANQYFLRGFDADHGTDLALSIDGIPINMVSHAHGQGFADTNFIIPETVERVDLSKGPYFANQGDFATAGAVNLSTRDDFERSSLGFGIGGSPGRGSPSYRALAIASPKWDAAKAMFAAEVGREDGPFDNPERWNKYKLFNKLSVPLSPTSSISIGESSYAGNWHGSGQIPARAVDNGLITRFGSIDSSEGGNTARHQLFVKYKLRPNEESELTALAFLGSYRFNLFSNFTLYLSDPDNGDEIEQVDRRTFYGASAAYRVAREVGGVRLETTIGGNVRSDDIHEELWHSRQREELGQLRGDDVHETMVGGYANEEVTLARWLRLNGGLRADLLSFAVDNRLATADPTHPRSGVDAADQSSPKASLIATPVERPGATLEVYLNWGHGFHSNDVRGVFTSPSVTPLVRAVGEEIGTRTRLWNRLDFAVAGWRLDLDNETTWNGDDGTTSVGPATRRYGLELEGRYEVGPWLALDGAVTFTHSQFAAADRENGGGLALAPKQTWAGGVSARHELGPGVLRGGLRFYGIGNRPASDDGIIVAPGFTQLDLHLGYRHRWFDLAFDVENLLNGQFRSAQFATVSRLRTEPGAGQPLPSGFTCGSKARLAPNPNTGANDGRFWGCEDVNFTPAYPITLRVMATIFLD
jgi:TonB family protein